jgi:hypothetical protein
MMKRMGERGIISEWGAEGKYLNGGANEKAGEII